MSRRIKILLGSLFFIAGAAFLTTYIIKIQEDSFADEIITQSSNKFEDTFSKMLTSTSKTVLDFKYTIQSDKQLTNESLTQTLTSLIENENLLSGIALSSDDFSYLIYNENSSWAVTYDSNLTDSISNWQRLNSRLEVVSEWTDVYKAFPSVNRLDSIVAGLERSDFVWISSVGSMSEMENFIGILFNTPDKDGKEMIAGLIYNTPQLGRSFSSVLKFNNPLVTLITDNNNTVTPIITSDSLSIKNYNQLNLTVNELVFKWISNDSSSSRSFFFEALNKPYWTRIVGFPNMLGLKGFAVTISAEDLALTEKKQEQLYLYLAIGSGVASLFFLILLLIRPRIKKNKLFDVPEITNAELLKLIQKGETEYIEFKSSLRWDYREEKVNKILEDVILKSINAFANAKGGNLFIGVDDDMDILGLENDFKTLKKQDVDYFELHLRKLIVNQYGIGFSNDSLKINFPDIDSKTICFIRIRASENPLFLKTRNKQGHEVEKFYVRSGNASQEISSLTEINKYLKRRFGN